MNKFDSHDFAVDEVITWEMVLNDSQNKPEGNTGMLPQEYFYTAEPITKNGVMLQLQPEEKVMLKRLKFIFTRGKI